MSLSYPSVWGTLGQILGTFPGITMNQKIPSMSKGQSSMGVINWVTGSRGIQTLTTGVLVYIEHSFPHKSPLLDLSSQISLSLPAIRAIESNDP